MRNFASPARATVTSMKYDSPSTIKVFAPHSQGLNTFHFFYGYSKYNISLYLKYMLFSILFKKKKKKKNTYAMLCY